MTKFFERLLTGLWNALTGGRNSRAQEGLRLGWAVQEGQPTRQALFLPQPKRTEHIAVLGRTGSGKSTLLRAFAQQDIQEGRGFLFFDLHGDATPLLLGAIAAQERQRGQDLSHQVIVVSPADPEFSVGLNALQSRPGHGRFIQVAEVAAILRRRWQLDSFGPRTDELLRNALFVLAENGLTLLEMTPLLGSAPFRAQCLRRVENPEVRSYFETRYAGASAAMQHTLSGPVLNKLGGFTADPHFRHILGQRQSTFSLLDAMDQGAWVLLNLEKGRLGEQALTLGSLFLTQAKNALFSRKQRHLFSFYCDEMQNLVAHDSGLEELLSEARKFGIGICSANQYLDQYPAPMRAAILAIGTHIFFQLSSADANQVATALDGGKTLAETLKNLPHRQFVVKSGHRPSEQALAPTVKAHTTDAADLARRSRQRWARRRVDIETDIRTRLGEAPRSQAEVLDGWE